MIMTTLELIAERYRIDGLLGQGGMGSVYRVTDTQTGRSVALKRVLAEGADDGRLVTLLEREFHTLAELAHPSVIEVYDYGVDDRGPYYTMELLEGSSMRSLTPMPWQRACAAARDAASALALLHSRRLIHRDVTGSNILVTEGRPAKLIDFGALVPMGPAPGVVGTPSHIAPEAVQGQALDGRTDLFALGVALYQALTARPAYRAGSIGTLRQAWRTKPVEPRALVPDIPPELDDFILAMMALERSARPAHAAEVIERLTAIAGLPRLQQSATSQAYLSTPKLVGRDAELQRMRRLLLRALGHRGGAMLIHGPAGAGRSRMLDAVVLEAKLLGVTVLRARADETDERFGVAQRLVGQLLDALPSHALASARKNAETWSALFGSAEMPRGDDETRVPAAPALRSLDPEHPESRDIQATLAGWMLGVATRRPILVAVDDVDRIEQPSAAFLSVLVQRASEGKLAVVTTAQSGALGDRSLAYQVIEENSRGLELRPLTLGDEEQLLDSVFGRVPNVDLLASRLHELTRGNPRDCMDLVQHLFEAGEVRYEHGTWALPASGEDLALPASLAEAWASRVAALSMHARQLAQVHVLSIRQRWTEDDYVALALDMTRAELRRALGELVSAGALSGDGESYAIEHRAWLEALEESLDEEARRLCHRGLARLCKERDDDLIGECYHLFSAGLDREGLELFEPLFTRDGQDLAHLTPSSQLRNVQLGRTHELALEAARRLGRSKFFILRMRLALTQLAVTVQEQWFAEYAPQVLAQLKHDSGWDIWHTLDPSLPPIERATQAIQQARERHDALPELEQGFEPLLAVKHLTTYVAVGIAISARTMNDELRLSLPALLEPFSVLSPAVDAVRQNAEATVHFRGGRVERAADQWRGVIELLEAADPAQVPLAQAMRDAVTYAVGRAEAQFGLVTAERWAARLDNANNAKMLIGALEIRRTLCLQQGDWDAAETYRRRAEQLTIDRNVEQVFGSRLSTPLLPLVCASDVIGIKRACEFWRQEAGRHPGCWPMVHLADAYYHRLRGDHGAARDALDRCLERTDPAGREGWASAVWIPAAAAYVELLLDLHRVDEAYERGMWALSQCERLQVGSWNTHEIGRVVAMVEGGLGRFEEAFARVHEAIQARIEMGVTGLNLGILYETAARLAIGQGDKGKFAHYAELAREQYCRCPDSAYTFTYQRLMADARRADVAGEGAPGGYAQDPRAELGITTAVTQRVESALTSCEDTQGRALAGIRLLCEGARADAGHLYLIRKGDVHLAASWGQNPAEADPTDLARRCLMAEVENVEEATMTAALQTAVHSAAQSDDAFGFVPLMLYTVGPTSFEIAGIALLASAATSLQGAQLSDLAMALGDCFARHGDTQALPAVA